MLLMVHIRAKICIISRDVSTPHHLDLYVLPNAPFRRFFVINIWYRTIDKILLSRAENCFKIGQCSLRTLMCLHTYLFSQEWAFSIGDCLLQHFWASYGCIFVGLWPG